MRKAIVFLAVSGLIGLACGQPAVEWERTYLATDCSGFRDVRATRDGGFIAVGHACVRPDSARAAWLVKLNDLGDTLWTRMYRPAERSHGITVAEVRTGGFVIAVEGQDDTTLSAAFLIRTDADGDTLWVRRYTYGGVEYVGSVIPTSDGGFLLCGCTEDLGAGPFDAWAVKTDANGDTLWNRAFRFAVDDYTLASSVSEMDDGYILAGSLYRSMSADWQCFLAVLDHQGDTLWVRHYGSWADESLVDAKIHPNGGYALAVSVSHYDPEQPSGGTILRIAENGDSLWSAAVYGGGTWFNELRVLPDGGYAVSGYIPSGQGGQSYSFLRRLDCLGDSLWEMGFTAPYTGRGAFLALDRSNDGGFILSGNAMRDTLYGGAWALKTESDPLVTRGPAVSSPHRFTLLQNDPNPFNPRTEITFELTVSADVLLHVFDLLGREVAVLHEGMATAGEHRVSFDGTGLPSGIYVCRLEVDGRTESHKMVLLR
ncbi:T9SS type A sorting domain-containing protein [bacterium]|nr:T9SS type A sorting domain-containing protein [bacterium]MBU1985124.1 T9SS type A sorting domain-containing protein [bacterium]